jgi:heat shock protein HslJ
MKKKSRQLGSLFAVILLFAPVFLLVATLSGCTSVTEKPAHPYAKKADGFIHSQIQGKRWLLAGFKTATAFYPIMPGQGTTAWIMFNPDGTVDGHTGINAFSGTWKLNENRSGDLYPFRLNVRKSTDNKAANSTAGKFESDIFNQMDATRYLKTGKDSILLVDEQNETLLQFIFREAGSFF